MNHFMSSWGDRGVAVHIVKLMRPGLPSSYVFEHVSGDLGAIC